MHGYTILSWIIGFVNSAVQFVALFKLWWTCMPPHFHSSATSIWTCQAGVSTTHAVLAIAWQLSLENPVQQSTPAIQSSDPVQQSSPVIQSSDPVHIPVQWLEITHPVSPWHFLTTPTNVTQKDLWGVLRPYTTQVQIHKLVAWPSYAQLVIRTWLALFTIFSLHTHQTILT